MSLGFVGVWGGFLYCRLVGIGGPVGRPTDRAAISPSGRRHFATGCLTCQRDCWPQTAPSLHRPTRVAGLSGVSNVSNKAGRASRLLTLLSRGGLVASSGLARACPPTCQLLFVPPSQSPDSLPGFSSPAPPTSSHSPHSPLPCAFSSLGLTIRASTWLPRSDVSGAGAITPEIGCLGSRADIPAGTRGRQDWTRIGKQTEQTKRLLNLQMEVGDD
ncbi:unnamed protein product [Protopolystoma xenopodis]|uniref:Uncharacterized protein n=1 Tax=Protopolystoma xenopodis TaxID=117903 RepID=A0A3S5CJX0_9PLAT|nr:unnamed protein product [Protopolystoma xenopodis]